jgi:phosphoglycolate phosphatase
LVREFFTSHQIEPSAGNFARFFTTYLGYLEKMIPACDGDVCPGIMEGIATLRGTGNRPALGLLTGNVRRGAEIKLRRFNLWSEFQFGAYADDHEDRNCIAEVAKRRGEEALSNRLSGDEILVIGDTPHDIRCGRSIGAKVLAVGTGGVSVDELRTHQPDWAVTDMREIDLCRICGF